MQQVKIMKSGCGNLIRSLEADRPSHRLRKRSRCVVEKLNVFADGAASVSFGDIRGNRLSRIGQLRSEPQVDFRVYKCDLPNEFEQFDSLLPNDELHVAAVSVSKFSRVTHYSITPALH